MMDLSEYEILFELTPSTFHSRFSSLFYTSTCTKQAHSYNMNHRARPQQWPNFICIKLLNTNNSLHICWLSRYNQIFWPLPVKNPAYTPGTKHITHYITFQLYIGFNLDLSRRDQLERIFLKHLLQCKSTLLFNFPEISLHPTWLHCFQFLFCKHYMNVLQNPWSDPCSPDTTRPLSY